MWTVSELARKSATPLATIKFYLREGLIPQGNLRAAHRAFYDERHLRRVELVRAMRDIAGLSMTAMRGVCRLLDGEGMRDFVTVVARMIDALGARKGTTRATRAVALARKELLAMLRAQRMRVRKDARVVTDLAVALVAMRRALRSELAADAFVPYLAAMRALTKRDFRVNRHLVTDTASAAFGVTFAIVLWEPVLVLLRRVAFEHETAVAFRKRG